jgi:magnesium-transporting ATPase (P-type)
MERSKARILKYITIALMLSPLIFSIAGDIMLIFEYKQDFQTDDSIHSSLILKALGSLGFLSLVFLYFICVFLYFFINLNIEEKHGVKLNSLIFQLLGLGLLAALRFTYDVVICLINFFEKPSLELNIYYVLAVAGGILLILLAYLSNLSKLKIHSESPV